MACYHPLKAFLIGNNEITGKKVLKIVSYSTHHIDYVGSEFIPVESDNTWFGAKKSYFRYYTIPCGQCIGCRLDYSRQWANRLMMELEYHDAGLCWFLTLTYDNDHVPITNSVDDNTGEFRENLTLCKRDVQLFNKRLRKRYGDGIRFYLAGEYGEHTFRPHYHGIYFDLPLDFTHMKVWSRTEQGFTLYTLDELNDIWSNGRVIIAPVSWDTCAYTARYVTKKLTGEAKKFYEDFNLTPEFSLMSRRPGIARQYFQDHPDCIDDRIYLSTDRGGLSFRAPRYFKSLMQFDNDIDHDLDVLKKSKEFDERIKAIKMKNDVAKVDYLVYLKDVERKHEQGAMKLLRSDCEVY